MAGNGGVTLVQFSGKETHKKFPTLLTKDACVDVAFCEGRDDLLAACTSDGWLHLVADQQGGLETVGRWQGHKTEAASVDFSMHDVRLLLTTGWDGRVLVWDVQTGAQGGPVEIGNFNSFGYQAIFSPHDRRLAAVALGNSLTDGAGFGVGQCAAILDLSESGRAKTNGSVRLSHGCEVLSLDFDKYRAGVVITGAVDGLVRVWDVRNPTMPVSVLHGGHRMAVRKVKASPWTPGEAATVSYDLSLCYWRDVYGGGYSLARKFEKLHTEFVWGLDWSLQDRRLLATAGWDRLVHFVDL